MDALEEDTIMAKPLSEWTREELEAKIKEMQPLILEARDALPGITLATAKLRGIDLTLADRLEKSLEPWLITD